MIKKGLLIILVLATGVSAGYAAEFTAAGCGLGTMLFEGKTKKAHLILAATTNGLFGNQTFGISSETLGCTSDGVVKADKKLDVYAEVNLQRLSKEMAQGGGEYLDNLAVLMGCKDAASRMAFAQLAQQKYETLFPSENTDSSSLLKSLRTEMAVHPLLRAL